MIFYPISLLLDKQANNKDKWYVGFWIPDFMDRLVSGYQISWIGWFLSTREQEYLCLWIPEYNNLLVSGYQNKRYIYVSGYQNKRYIYVSGYQNKQYIYVSGYQNKRYIYVSRYQNIGLHWFPEESIFFSLFYNTYHLLASNVTLNG